MLSVLSISKSTTSSSSHPSSFSSVHFDLQVRDVLTSEVMQRSLAKHYVSQQYPTAVISIIATHDGVKGTSLDFEIDEVQYALHVLCPISVLDFLNNCFLCSIFTILFLEDFRFLYTTKICLLKYLIPRRYFLES